MVSQQNTGLLFQRVPFTILGHLAWIFLLNDWKLHLFQKYKFWNLKYTGPHYKCDISCGLSLPSSYYPIAGSNGIGPVGAPNSETDSLNWFTLITLFAQTSYLNVLSSEILRLWWPLNGALPSNYSIKKSLVQKRMYRNFKMCRCPTMNEGRSLEVFACNCR